MQKELNNDNSGRAPLKVIEFFSGMGGYHFALERCGVPFEVVRAYELNEVANLCYSATFGLEPNKRSIAVLQPRELDSLGANCWLMSPPCQPYTRGGKCLDRDDPRTAPLLNLLQILPKLSNPPEYFMLENVKNFDTSDSRDTLIEVLSSLGYRISEFLVTPWQFNIPNQRLRYYLLARRITKEGPINYQQKPYTHWPLEKIELEDNEKRYRPTETATCSSQSISPEEFNKLCPSLQDVINEEAHGSEEHIVPDKNILKSKNFRFDIVNVFSHLSSCFTKAYGSHHLFGSGSLVDPTILASMDPSHASTLASYDFDCPPSLLPRHLRFFTPWEVAVLHGVPIPLDQYPRSSHSDQPALPIIPSWLHPLYSHPTTSPSLTPSSLTTLQFPPTLTTLQRHKLLGNSLHIIVVATLMDLIFFPPSPSSPLKKNIF